MSADVRDTATNVAQRQDSLLLVVDIQTRLAPHVPDHEALIARARALVTAARMLDIPRRLTEHCADQIGPVVPAIRQEFAASEIFGKTCFGACDHAEFVEMLRASGRRHVAIAGMEAHVCVLQTALGLLDQGFAVTAVTDAIGSRRPRQEDRLRALGRLERAGAILAGTETVLFEWLHAGNDPAFGELLRVIKALP